MQRTAMRRIDANGVVRARPQPHIGAGLGAVAVQHVGSELPDHAHQIDPDHEVGSPGFAADRNASNAEFEARGDFRQRRLGALAAGEAVRDDADMVAALDLAVGEIQDMAENAADRGAHCVQDAKRLVGRHGSEPAFADEDSIARAERGAERHHETART